MVGKERIGKMNVKKICVSFFYFTFFIWSLIIILYDQYQYPLWFSGLFILSLWVISNPLLQRKFLLLKKIEAPLFILTILYLCVSQMPDRDYDFLFKRYYSMKDVFIFIGSSILLLISLFFKKKLI